MTKKIKITGKGADRINITGKALPHIEPAEFAAALGAEPCCVSMSGGLDAIAIGAIGQELLKRLRSTGGRPALEDADQICKVPLSAADVAALERIGEAIGEQTGTKPSLGQIASVILREQLVKNRSANSGYESTAATGDCFFRSLVDVMRP